MSCLVCLAILLATYHRLPRVANSCFISLHSTIPSHPVVQSRSSASVAIITFLVVATADTRMPFGFPFFPLFYFQKALQCTIRTRCFHCCSLAWLKASARPFVPSPLSPSHFIHFLPSIHSCQTRTLHARKPTKPNQCNDEDDEEDKGGIANMKAKHKKTTQESRYPSCSSTHPPCCFFPFFPFPFLYFLLFKMLLSLFFHSFHPCRSPRGIEGEKKVLDETNNILALPLVRIILYF